MIPVWHNRNNISETLALVDINNNFFIGLVLTFTGSIILFLTIVVVMIIISTDKIESRQYHICGCGHQYGFVTVVAYFNHSSIR